MVGACRQASNSGLFVGLTLTNNVEITIDRFTTVACLIHSRRSETQEEQRVMWRERKFARRRRRLGLGPLVRLAVRFSSFFLGTACVIAV